MNLKTKFPQMEARGTEPEFRSYFPFVLFFFTVLALIAVYVINVSVMRRVGTYGEYYAPMFFIFPWMNAAGITITNALYAFSGKAPEPISTTNYLLAIFSLIVVYVVAPTLFFFRWRKRRLEKLENPALPYRHPTVSFILGSVLLWYVVIPTVPTAVIQPVTFQNLIQAQALETNRDKLMDNLNAIAISARQYRILPKQLGGGEGTYKGYVLSSEMTLTQEGTFAIIVREDEVILHATSNENASTKIIVHLGKDGRLSQWRFIGLFESGPYYSPWKQLLKSIFRG